jgi:hypothetical protein
VDTLALEHISEDQPQQDLGSSSVPIPHSPRPRIEGAQRISTALVTTGQALVRSLPGANTPSYRTSIPRKTAQQVASQHTSTRSGSYEYQNAQTPGQEQVRISYQQQTPAPQPIPAGIHARQHPSLEQLLCLAHQALFSPCFVKDEAGKKCAIYDMEGDAVDYWFVVV